MAEPTTTSSSDTPEPIGYARSLPIASAPKPPADGFRHRKRRTSLSARGEPMVWLTGGCVAAAVLMIVGLLVFILAEGFGTFWPAPLVQIKTTDGKTILGEPSRSDVYVYTEQVSPAVTVDPDTVVAVDKTTGLQTVRYEVPRTLYKVGNYDVSGEDFVWAEDRKIAERMTPTSAFVFERTGWGNAYGTLEAVIVDGQRTEGADAAWSKFEDVHPTMRDYAEQIDDIGRGEQAELASETNAIRLELSGARRTYGEGSAEFKELQASHETRLAEIENRNAELEEQKTALKQKRDAARVVIRTADGKLLPSNPSDPDEPLFVHQVVRAYPANQLGVAGKTGVYIGRWWEYLTTWPREANTEGGVFPAIVGTVMLTFIMVLFVVPIGVIAAIYLREYAKQGLLVSIIRIAVNNLAGVPSIVYGLFGLGFFCYIVGRYIDSGSAHPVQPSRWWWYVLVTLVIIGIACGLTLFLNLLSRWSESKTRRPLIVRLAIFIAWIITFGVWGVTAVLLLAVLDTTPYFDGFFTLKAAENAATLGKSAMLWASMTLALLTLPLVIVATEEALAAVPRSMREGSYACGASKWQTIRRIVLPRAMPGVMTGAVLAIARGAGEVAPIMLVGALKTVNELPISGHASEVFGLNRSFMHLGYHIFDLGFHSRNSEAAKSMVYTTTLLLIVIVVLLNVTAIYIRSRLRKAYAGGAF